jgi:hypothetical protein
MLSLLLAPLLCLLVTAAPKLARSTTPSKCRFSPLYSQEEILHNSTSYAWDVFYWEGNFHQNNVGYNTANGMSYDGTLLNSTSGLATEKHPFSAASKETHAPPDLCIRSHRKSLRRLQLRS